MTHAITRAVRACGTALTALLLVTCTGEPVAPGAPRLGQVSITPIWPEASRLGGLVLDNVRLTVVRLPADTLARVARPFASTTTQLQLTVPVLLLGPSENLQVTLDLLSGPTLLFSGTQLLTVGAGGGGSPIPIPVTFACPPATCPAVASLTLAPRDTTIRAGGTFAYAVTAQDAQQAPVTLFYTSWSSSSAAVTIDGAGVVTAGASRATVTITAATPSGARDSTTLTVVPPATQLVIISGDNQSASILSPLPLPLVVEVRAADGLPVAGATVTFAALSGGGSVDSATATTDLAGRATSGATLGATVGAQSFTATASGTNSVTFSATATSGGVKVWTGAVDGNWTTAGNWTPAAVPTAGDSVAIPAGAPIDPTLTGNATMRALALQGTGAALFIAGTLTVTGTVALPDTNSFIDFASGQLSAGSVTLSGFQAFIDASLGSASVSGPITLSGNRAFFEGGPGSALGAVTLSGNAAFLSHYGGTQGPITASGSSAFWEATGAVTVTGTPAIQLGGTAFISSFGAPAQLTINGDVTVGGTAAFFDISADDHWTINGTLQTTGGGFLRMNQVTDTLEVNGSVSFGGGDESTQLTAGQLFVSGNISQTGVATSFVGTGTHTVFLDGSGSQTLNFASPGFAASRFQNVIIANSAGGVTVTSDVFATGTVGVTPTAVRTLSGNGSTLFTTILNVSNFTFNNLLLNFAGSTVATFDTVTFQGYAPTATPLTIVHPGAASPLPFQDVVFTVTPSTGFYLDATDSNPGDGVPLVIDMLNPTPASPGGRVQTAGGATVNWTGVGPILWTGATSTNWNTATNWSTGAVPTNADDVVIPSGGNQPTVTTSCSAKSLTVNVGATLNLNAIDCQVAGNVFADGSIIGSGAVQIATTAQIRGNVPNLILSGPVTLAGRTVASGNVTLTGASADLVLNGNTFSVALAFITQSTAVFTMTNPLDSLLVGGTATFGGNSTNGRLTAGTLQLAGDLTQTGSSSPASFAPSGTHRTTFPGGTTRTVSFANPGVGASASHFQDLDLSTTTGRINITSATVWVAGTLTSRPSGAAPLIASSSGLFPGLQVRGGIDVTGLALDSMRMDVRVNVVTTFDNVTLDHVDQSLIQLVLQAPGQVTPTTLNNVQFLATPNTGLGGLYLQATDTDGIAPFFTVNLAGATPAAATAFTTFGGAVVNWPPAAPVITWTGAVNTDWNVAGNWSPARAPLASDNVSIPFGTTDPQLSGNVAIKDLLVASGRVKLDVFTLAVSGSLNVGGSIDGLSGSGLTLSCTGGQPVGATAINVPTVVTGNCPLFTSTQFANLTIQGSLDVGNLALSVIGDLSTQGTGVLVMTGPGSVVVTGNAIFDGGNEGGNLQAGVLTIGGNFTQGATTSPESFVSTGTHLTAFSGTSPTVTFATPGSSQGSAHFQQIRWTGTGTMTLGSDVFSIGTMDGGPGVTGTIVSINHALQVGNFVSGGAVFDGTRLIIDDRIGLPIGLDNATFSNMSSSADQLTVIHPGTGGPFSFSNLIFNSVPTTGFYLSATDPDGVAPFLTLDLVNPSPATPGSLTQVSGGAVINWPAAAPVFTWTGATSTDWSTGSNWSTGTVPTAADNVVIPAGPPNQPTIGFSSAAKDLTIQPGATLSGGDASLDVFGNLDASGLLAGCCSDFIGMHGGTVRGNFDNVTLAALTGAVVTLNGTVTLTNSTVQVQGELILGGQALNLGQGTLNITNGTGLLTMTNPADLVVTGIAEFSGGDETGRLTAGVIQTQSLFQGSGGSQHPASFFASGNHRVVLAGPASSTVFFANPGASRFQDLDVTGVSAVLTTLSNVVAAGQLIATPVGTNGPTITGAGTLTAGGADIGASSGFTALTFDQKPLVLSGGTITGFDRVTFDTQNPNGTAFTVNNVGQGTPYTFSNLTFTTTLQAGGFHLVANDLDGPSVPLVIDVVNSSPASGAGVSQATNGAVLNWPPGGSSITWTGATSTDWFTGSNWSGGVVPAISDTAVIPAGPPGPVLIASPVVGGLTVQPSALLDLNAFVVVVNGPVDNAGLISSVTNGGVSLAGTGSLVRGVFNTDVSVAGSYTLNGRVSAGNFTIANGSLDMSGRTLSVSTFSTLGTGVVKMANPVDSLLVGTFAVFQGGNTVGLLTDGVLSVGGDFLQDATNSTTSFAPSGSHKTVLTARSAASIFFFSPGLGSGGSHFQVLDVSQATGGYSLNVNSFADSLISTSAAVTLSGGNSLTVRRAQVSGLTLDNVPLILDEQGTIGAENLSNVTFQGFPTTGAQVLTISGPGSNVGLRPAFGSTNVNFPNLPTGAGNLYVKLTSTNAEAFIITMTGSNQSPQVGGNGPALSDPPNQTTVSGAQINWP